MKQNILHYLNKLQAYKTAIKNLHWSSENMSEHKLLDDIEGSVSKIQDDIAEMSQGVFGKIQINELKPKRYKITNVSKLLEDITNDSHNFLRSVTRNKNLIGVKSNIENFIGEMNKFVYLLRFCIKEETQSINESFIRKIIQEEINKKSR